MFVHRFQEPAFVAEGGAFEVDCIARTTICTTVTEIMSYSVVTATKTVSFPSIYIISHSTTTIRASSASATDICTSTVGSATASTTQHIKCAPTNLISSMDGYGIAETHGSKNSTQGLAPGSDPSACCQLCVDTEGCAASEDDPDAGNCFLWYTTKPTCGLGFSYAAGDQKLKPGTGFLVQSGCGRIEMDL